MDGKKDIPLKKKQLQAMKLHANYAMRRFKNKSINKRAVLMGKSRFYGSQCPICKETEKYNERFDAYYCEKCNMWTEEKCGDPKCSYCLARTLAPIS